MGLVRKQVVMGLGPSQETSLTGQVCILRAEGPGG